MTNPYMNSQTKITEKKTSGQIDEVENFVQIDDRKMNRTDNNWLSGRPCEIMIVLSESKRGLLKFFIRI